MKRLKLALIALLLMCSSAFAQDRTTVAEFSTLINQASREAKELVYVIIIDDPSISASITYGSKPESQTFILVSPFTFSLIETKHEWAFIIFHEIGHKLLNHLENTDRSSSESRHEAEYAADARSLELMQKYGYRLDQAIRLMVKYSEEESFSHPSGKDRITRMRAKIAELEAKEQFQEENSELKR